MRSGFWRVRTEICMPASVTTSPQTGSADLAAPRGSERAPVPKHTWAAGWAPAGDPKLVFCVFVDHTMATSSHSAVWIARDLLRTQEIRDWMAEAERGTDAPGTATSTTDGHAPGAAAPGAGADAPTEISGSAEVPEPQGGG